MTTSKNTKYTAAVIGTGRIGYLFQKDKKREQPAAHSNALAGNKRIKLTAGCDIDKKRLKEWHQDYPGASAYNSVNALFAGQRPQIVVIAVNEEAHLKTTLKAIKHKPRLIILEKPVAANLKDALKIKKYARKSGVSILVNHERRYSEDYRIVKSLIEDNKLGKINSVFASLWSGARIWAEGCGKTGANSLFHDGTHLIDILDFLFPGALKKTAIDFMNMNKKHSKVTQLNLHFKNPDCLYHIELSGRKKYFGFDIDIRGSEGRAVVGNGYLDISFRKSSPYYTNFYSLVRDNSIKRPETTGYFSNMIQNAVDFLDGKKPLVSSIYTGVKVIKTLDKIEKKMLKSI